MKYTVKDVHAIRKSPDNNWDRAVFNLRMSLGEGNSMEIGVLYGSSTIPMAAAQVNVSPTYKHFCIDPWVDGSIMGRRVADLGWTDGDNSETWIRMTADEAVPAEIPEQSRIPIEKGEGSKIFNMFISNVTSFDKDLFKHIVIIKNYSEEVNTDKFYFTPLAMLFIDGGHTKQDVFKDLLKFNSYVKIGGVIAFDDWGGFGVQEGYEEAKTQLIGKWSSPEQFAHSRVFIKREE